MFVMTGANMIASMMSKKYLERMQPKPSSKDWSSDWNSSKDWNTFKE